MKTLYLDDAATTRVSGNVLRRMTKLFTLKYGNPSSSHEMGERARKAVTDARIKLAQEINAKPWELIFTSGVTEANNLALQGLVRASKRKKIIISAIEHASVMEICSYLEKHGYEIVKIPVNRDGLIDLDFLKREIDSNTLLVSVMHVNNVLGTIQDLGAIGEICAKHQVLLHTDAAQSFGKLEIDVKKMNVGMLSASSHKIGGPKGAGFLYVKEEVKIEPIIFGGGQERGLRGGTENVPAIVGFSAALDEIKKINKKKIEILRDKLFFELEGLGGNINGSRDRRIYNNIHVSFRGIDGGALAAFLSAKNIYVSTGSACETKRKNEDHVLSAISLERSLAKGSIRISLNSEIRWKDIKKIILAIKSGIGLSRTTY